MNGEGELIFIVENAVGNKFYIAKIGMITKKKRILPLNNLPLMISSISINLA